MRINPFAPHQQRPLTGQSVSDPGEAPSDKVSLGRKAGRVALGGLRLAGRGLKLAGRGAVAGARLLGRLARKQPKIAAAVAGVLVAACVGVIIATHNPGVSTTPPPTPPPVVSVVSQAAGGYVVQPGDTLFGIARRYGVSVEQLAAANGISDPNVIGVGQQLTIPGAQLDVRSCYDRYYPEAVQLATGYDPNLLTALTCFHALQPGQVPLAPADFAAQMQARGVTPGPAMGSLDSMQQLGVLGNERAVVQAYYEIYRDYALQ